MKIALIGASAKPYHAGHDGMIRMASKEVGINGLVRVFVSLSDRKRPGELPILGSDMKVIWKDYIEPTLPANVSVEYVQVPIKEVYRAMEDAEKSGSDDIFYIYADPTDLASRFGENSLKKNAGTLYKEGRIILRPIERTETVDVSGTKMRAWLKAGDKKSFVAHLPPAVDGDAVWDILSQHV